MKILSLFKTQENISRAEFKQYWVNNYLASQLKNNSINDLIKKVAHNHVVSFTPRDDVVMPPPDWAGIAETWFANEADALTFLADEQVNNAASYHNNVFAEVIHMLCSEHEIWNTGLQRTTIKLMAFFEPSKTMNREQSQHYWRNNHVKLGDELLNPQQYAPRYVQNKIRPGFPDKSTGYNFVGCPELWFDSETSAREMFTGQGEEKLKKLAEDEGVFSNQQTALHLFTDEVLVYP